MTQRRPKNPFKANPEADAERNVVEEIAAILDKDKSIRAKVFRELHDKQQETILALTFQDDTTQNARGLAFFPESIDTSTAEVRVQSL